MLIHCSPCTTREWAIRHLLLRKNNHKDISPGSHMCPLVSGRNDQGPLAGENHNSSSIFCTNGGRKHIQRGAQPVAASHCSHDPPPGMLFFCDARLDAKAGPPDLRPHRHEIKIFPRKCRDFQWCSFALVLVLAPAPATPLFFSAAGSADGGSLLTAQERRACGALRHAVADPAPAPRSLAQ